MLDERCIVLQYSAFISTNLYSDCNERKIQGPHFLYCDKVDSKINAGLIHSESNNTDPYPDDSPVLHRNHAAAI